ncbi:MAG: ABC transporter substrate-binding protein, partial [Acidaminococcaceae bacterium]|nr:ABC transporter substrate-binding protein [Acidaminococcaceae bacterium]
MFLLIFILITVLAAGCGKDSGSGAAASPEGNKKAAASVQQNFPAYTVKDDAGRTVALKAKPQRIVSVTYGTD